jgi:hypothetical protein
MTALNPSAKRLPRTKLFLKEHTTYALFFRLYGGYNSTRMRKATVGRYDVVMLVCPYAIQR